MHPLRVVIGNIDEYLGQRSVKPDEAYLARNKHFDDLKALIDKADNIDVVIKFIREGVVRFRGAIPMISSQRYHDFLLQLIEAIQLEDSVVAQFKKHMPPGDFIQALRNSWHSSESFQSELFKIASQKNQVMENFMLDAIEHENLEALQFCMRKRVRPSYAVYRAAKSSKNPDIIQLIVQPFHITKHHLMLKGAVHEIPIQQAQVTLTDALLSSVYSDSEDKKMFIKSELERLQQMPDLQPVLAIGALAALKKHDQGRVVGKQLSIIFSKDIQQYVALDNPVMGIYNTKNSVYVNAQHDRATMPMFAHELTHFVAGEVYKFDSNPFSEKDEDSQKKFMNIIYQVQQKLKTLGAQLENGSIQDRLALAAFTEVYDAYPKESWATELIARVPQVIALLGEEKGRTFLSSHFPALLNYYDQKFLPDCMVYLSAHDGVRYLDMPSLSSSVDAPRKG